MERILFIYVAVVLRKYFNFRWLRDRWNRLKALEQLELNGGNYTRSGTFESDDFAGPVLLSSAIVNGDRCIFVIIRDRLLLILNDQNLLCWFFLVCVFRIFRIDLLTTLIHFCHPSIRRSDMLTFYRSPGIPCEKHTNTWVMNGVPNFWQFFAVLQSWIVQTLAICTRLIAKSTHWSD